MKERKGMSLDLG